MKNFINFSLLFLVFSILFVSCKEEEKPKEKLDARHIIFFNIENLRSSDIDDFEIENIELLLRNGVFSLAVEKNNKLGLNNYTSIPINNESYTLFSAITEKMFKSSTAFLTNTNRVIDSTQLGIDKYIFVQEDFLFNKAAVNLFKIDKPTFTFIDYSESENSGENSRLDHIKAADSILANILEEVGYSVMYGKTVIILTAFNFDNYETEYDIPFVINGIGIRVGYELLDKVNLDDIASTILNILELNQPVDWTGKPIEKMLSQLDEE